MSVREIATDDRPTLVKPSNVESVRAILHETESMHALRLGKANQQGTAIVLTG
ncbi:hypothetical protein SAMN03159496_05048 [Rhizobium sp. NFR07]|nr:hypothetical protein SAMN03159496_05048 [Rhizobium sp. NFR07]